MRKLRKSCWKLFMGVLYIYGKLVIIEIDYKLLEYLFRKFLIVALLCL